jgi:hypothetical protein
LVKALLVGRCGAPVAARKHACAHYLMLCGIMLVNNAFAKAGNS